MGLPEKGNGCWQDADDLEGLARLVARQDHEGAQMLGERYDAVIRLEDIGLCAEAAYECRAMLEISELPQVYRFVALEHVVFGEEERAVLIARECVEIDPEGAERHRALGDVYFELEKYADAAGAYQRAVELGCSDGGLLLSLGRCHELLDDHKSAAEWQGRAPLAPGRSKRIKGVASTQPCMPTARPGSSRAAKQITCGKRLLQSLVARRCTAAELH